MPGRYESSDDYRYGFQGQEMDNEIKGVGNSLNYKYRMHDPRLGRFFAIDPLTKKYPHYSPYSFSGNKVIAWRELEGAEEIITIWQKDGDTYKRTVFDGVQLTRKIYDNAGNQMDNSSISAEQYQAQRKNYWYILSRDNSDFPGSDKYKNYQEPPTTGNLVIVPSDNKTNYLFFPERIHKHKRMVPDIPSLKESFKIGVEAYNKFLVHADPLVDGSEQSVETTKNIKTGIGLYLGLVSGGYKIIGNFGKAKQFANLGTTFTFSSAGTDIASELSVGNDKSATLKLIGTAVTFGTQKLTSFAINNNPQYSEVTKAILTYGANQYDKLFGAAAKAIADYSLNLNDKW